MSSLTHFNVDNKATDFIPEYVLREKHETVKWGDRAYRRFQCEIPIRYKYYNTENFSDEFKAEDCIAYNYSLNGMYFESTTPLQADLPVYIKMNGSSLSIPGFEEYEGHHAEVKWCKKKNGETNSLYGIGVQFYEPLIYSAEQIN